MLVHLSENSGISPPPSCSPAAQARTASVSVTPGAIALQRIFVFDSRIAMFFVIVSIAPLVDVWATPQIGRPPAPAEAMPGPG
ncbi:hypothetical protein C8N38_10493 [Rhodovulum kholense]|uniref:Uncharacterized protein n=1 Tax=Rhodovulum kholense TaxID=453584 RepID=A0A8E2VKG4_9RHOB|nr:hypothetical protein C8N38_10493 [Rhodovulum kholense]